MRLVIILDNGDEIEIFEALEDFNLDKPIAQACLAGETLDAVQRAQTNAGCRGPLGGYAAKVLSGG